MCKKKKIIDATIDGKSTGNRRDHRRKLDGKSTENRRDDATIEKVTGEEREEKRGHEITGRKQGIELKHRRMGGKPGKHVHGWKKKGGCLRRNR
jgi:hypothetical protein